MIKASVSCEQNILLLSLDIFKGKTCCKLVAQQGFVNTHQPSRTTQQIANSNSLAGAAGGICVSVWTIHRLGRDIT